MAGVVVHVLEGAGHDLTGDEVPAAAHPGGPLLKRRDGVGDGLAVGLAQRGPGGLGRGGHQQRERFWGGEDEVPAVAAAQAGPFGQRPAPGRPPPEHGLQPGGVDRPGQPEGGGALAQPGAVRGGPLPVGDT